MDKFKIHLKNKKCKLESEVKMNELENDNEKDYFET